MTSLFCNKLNFHFTVRKIIIDVCMTVYQLMKNFLVFIMIFLDVIFNYVLINSLKVIKTCFKIIKIVTTTNKYLTFSMNVEDTLVR